jgi:acetate kinase
MGFTPLEGLVMATRSGTIDPGLVLWLVAEGGLSAEEVRDGLDRQSGLTALCGTGDVEEVLRREASGDPAAEAAMAAYLHRLLREVGGMAAALEGVDAIAFTGGVGEHGATVRERATASLGWLGAELDLDRNDAAQGDGIVSTDGSATAVLVVEAREDLEIARQARELLSR